MRRKHLLLIFLAFILGSQIRAQCTFSLVPIPSSCNAIGGYSLIIPSSACTATAVGPYDLFWGFNGCQQPTLTQVPGPGTYVITFTSTCTTPYNVVFQDANSVFFGSATATTGVSGTVPLAITPTSFTNPSCFGGCNGSRNIVWSGTGPISATLDPGTPGQTVYSSIPTGFAVTFTSLCAGTHTFFATDGNNCTYTTGLTFTLGQPTAISGNTASSNPSCFGGSNGTFSVSPSGGTPGYTVSFSSGASSPTGAGGTVAATNLPLGVVTATVRDSKACTFTTSANITQPTSIIATPSQTNVNCAGVCNGAASFSVTGGGSSYSFTWSPSGGNAATATSLCALASPYTLTILDNNNCLTTRTVSISSPPAIVVSTLVTNLTCNSVCIGAATVSASGPTSAVTFTWLANGGVVISTSSVITNQCAGNYTVLSHDAATSATCQVSNTVTITQPPQFTVTSTTQSISCATNTCSGSATVNASGSNGAPYTYSWTPGPTTSSVGTSLCTGPYTVTVTDPSGCTKSSTLNIDQPPAIIPGVTIGSVTCAGALTGSIGVSPSGGNAPYTFTLVSSTTTLTSGPSFTNLAAGTYTLFIKDNTAGACAQTTVVTVPQAPTLLTSISTGSVKCFGGSTGSLTGNPVGGTPGYTLSWTTSTGTIAGATIINLTTGNYTFNVRDANGCTVAATSSVTQPTNITFTVTPTNVLCNGGATGVLSGNALGGTPGYTFSWSNGFTGATNSGLTAGVYSYTITDQNGCLTTSTSAVSQPSAIAMTMSLNAVSCAGGSNGSATITPSGGTAPFSFAFNTSPAGTPTNNTTGIATGLSGGPYSATVTDANSCSQPTIFTISQPAILSAAITGTQNSCTACTGAATVTASNGSPGYSFVWTNSVSTTVSSASVATGLCSGPYTVTVTDSKACIATATVNVQQTVISAAVSGGTGIQCFGACTGSAVASPSGGTPPYSYTWMPSAQTTQTATGLCAQVYTVTVKELGGSGCSSSSTISISSPTSISTTTLQSNLTCFSVCTGSLSANATGGTGPMNYSWSPGGQTTSSITGLCAGSYTLRITDANGCTTTPQTFSITQPASITPNFTNTLPSGCTFSNGVICVGPTGGSGSGYTFTWSPVTGNSSCLSSLSSGVYSVVIRDGSGCSISTSTMLNSPSGPTISVSQKSVACFQGLTGGATITATGAGPFTYTWSPAIAGNTPVVNAIPAGTYVASIQDANSCVTNQSVVITQATSLTLNQTVTNSRCAGGAATGSITLSPTGATPAYTYSWSGPSLSSSSQNVTGLGPGLYSLLVTDANACTTSSVFTITAPPPITITASSTKSVICNGFTNGSVTASASGGTPPLSYTWSPLGAFSGSTTATVLNLGPGVYSVSAVDGNSCVSSPASWTLSASTLTSAIVSQSATCSNSNNATATLNVTGGTPTFTFSWSTGGSTTNVLSNLGLGNYTATVVDADGCISQKGFTISSASLFTITSTPGQPKCNGACNGSIAVNPTGASGTVSYSWSPSGSGQNPTGLCAASYIVVATDGNSCTAQNLITLTNPPAIAAIVSSTNASCNGTCNGVAVVTATNAIGAITVTWLPSGPSSATATALCAQNYTVSVSDANGCLDSQTFTITNPAALVLNSAVGPASCNSPNGSVTVIPSGGTPGYSYTWSPNVSSTSSATALPAQIYVVVVKDNASCSNTITIPLSNSNGPVAAISSTNVQCFGQSNGAVSVGALSGGVPPYQPAVWISPLPSTTANALSGIPAGNYTVQLEDSQGCKTFTGATVTGPSSLSILPNMGLPTCNGICNGSVTLNVSGGVPGYSYSWTPAAPNTSVLTGLCAGQYSVSISHKGGACTQTTSFSVPGQVNLTFTDNIVNNTCFGNCNGVASVSVIPTAGIPSPFVFSWSNGQTGPGPMATSINSLCNSLYSVTATGANGCFNVYTVNITSPSQLSVSAAVAQPSCNQSNGSVTVTPGGGSGGSYTFNWSNGATTSTLGNLIAGFYQLTLSDNLGCSQNTLIAINNSSGITGHTITTQDIPCGATCTGAATIVASGTNTPITYNWINPAVNSQTLSNLCAGSYFVQMQDAQGCVRNASAIINAATSISISPFVLPPSCGGFSDGTVHVVTSGGTPTYNFSWLPLGPNSGTINNIGAGSYTLTVTDTSPGGCPTTSVINISSINGPVVAITSTNINCFNACTGAVSANVTGTATPFSYNWSGGGSTPNLSNQCKGVLTLTVTDANACIVVKSATLTDNPQLQTGLPAVTQPSCNLSNGQATVNVFGGVGPYTYSWTTGATGPSLSNLSAGLYQVMIKDALNCQQTQNIVINNSNGITGQTFSVQNVTCGGSCDGAATVTPIGGNPPIAFSWINPSLPATGSVVTNLCPGSYFVQMQDAQGCLRTASTSISPATNITITPLVIPPACQTSNGIISITASGGTPNYSFSWIPAAPNTPSLLNVSPGSYTVTVSDSSPGGCATSTVINISNLNSPSVAFTTTNISCFGACTGAALANVTGTATPFSYNWSGGGNTPALSNLCQGVITLTVTDSHTCVAVKSVTITENPQLQAGVPQVTQPSCNQCNGAADITAFGGVSPYTYSWTTGATGSSVSNLCAGLYQVLIKDNANCQQTKNIVINNSSGIAGETFSVQNVACSGNCNGGVTVTPIGGTNPISFSWINPALASTANSVSNLCVGTYFVKMTDAAGCVRTSSTDIVAATDMTVTSNLVQPGCGQTNGTIDLLVSGGTAPYTFSWSPGAGSTASLSGLAPGNYSVVVTDQNGNGCSQTANFNLSNLNGPSLSFTQNDITCFGLCNGSVNAISTGTSATTFTWSTGSSSAGSGTTCAGVITLTASANGCKTVKSFTIDENPKLELNFNLKSLSCLNACDALIDLQPVGGRLSYTFAGTTASNSNQSSTLCVGNYTLSVTDALGCEVDSVIQLKNPPPITPTLISQNSSCSSVADGSASVLVSGGKPNYKFQWTGPKAFAASTNSITNIFSGDYTLSVTDTLGCKRDSVLRIITTVTIQADAGLDTLVCPGSSVAISGLNSKGVATYNWFLLPNTAAPLATTPTLALMNATENYTLRLVTISSSPGCFDTDDISVSTYTTPYIDAGPSFTIPVFSTVTIGGNPTTSGVGTVTWSPDFSLSDVNAENPVASNTVEMTYTATIMYGKGCLVSDTMQVILYPEIKVNNGFSPNGDGKNDFWLIDYLEQFPDNTVEIYNRWGDLLFFSRGYQTPFNGKYKGNDLPVGTYYYVIHLNHPAYPKPYTGPLTIFR